MSVFATPWVPAGTPAPPVTPYITLSEYAAAATAVDTGELVPGGTTAQQAQALAVKIRAASAWADRICYQVLAATLDVDTAAGVMVRRDGTIRVPCRYWPVLEVDSFLVGPVPSQLGLVAQTDMTLIGRKVLSVPVRGASPAVPQFGARLAGSRLYAQWSYVNGWPNTLLTATAAAGSQTLTVASTLGFYPGRTYRVSDAAAGTEDVTVTAVTATAHGGPGTLTLAAPLAFGHTPPAAPDGVSVTGLPEAVKEAVVHLTSALIKSRGAEAIVMDSIGGSQSAKTAGFTQGSIEDLEVAEMMLSDYHRVT